MTERISELIPEWSMASVVMAVMAVRAMRGMASPRACYEPDLPDARI